MSKKSKSKPSINHGVPAKDYHAIDAINASFLKKLAVSPLYAHTDKFDGSKAADFGSYIHALALDPSELANFACLPTTGEGAKKARDAWKAANPDGILLSPSEMEKGKAILEKLNNHPEFVEMKSAKDYASEVTLLCEHPTYGFPMKARLDMYAPGYGVGDIKTFGSPITKKALFWRVRDSGYDVQFAHYRRMLQLCGESTPDLMEFYFCETETDGLDIVTVSLDEGWQDSMALRSYVREITPELDMTFNFNCPNCSNGERMDVPMTVQFFWPES